MAFFADLEYDVIPVHVHCCNNKDGYYYVNPTIYFAWINGSISWLDLDLKTRSGSLFDPPFRTLDTCCNAFIFHAFHSLIIQSFLNCIFVDLDLYVHCVTLFLSDDIEEHHGADKRAKYICQVSSQPSNTLTCKST